MIPFASAVITAVLVLRVTGFRRRWPWRVGRLEADGTAWNRSVRPSHHGTSRGGRQRQRQREPVLGVGRAGLPGSTRSGGHPGDGHTSDTAIIRSLSLTADLLVVAVSAGHSIHTAIEAVAEFDDGPVGAAFVRMWQRFSNGSAIIDELRDLPVVLGEQARLLSSTLAMGLSSGAPPEPALQRLAERERRRLRRRVEVRIRRLPILLLGPLILLTLPSFVILSIIPVIVVTAQKSGW